jgi:hypothetical protein
LEYPLELFEESHMLATARPQTVNNRHLILLLTFLD